MNIVWLSWKDMDHLLAGGAEVVTDQLLTRAAQAGHQVTLLTSHYPGAAVESSHNGYTIVRRGSRLTVYLKAWLYYRRNLKATADVVIDECNTLPFFARWYAGKKARGYMFFHMLCRQIWFYELPKPFGVIGYILEPLYLRLLRRWPVITVSESTKQDLMRNGFKAETIAIISEGLKLEPLASLAAVEKYPQPTVLSFGSMRSMKRTLDQLKAFEIAKQQLPELQFKIAGNTQGAYGRKVIEAIAASPHYKDIQVLGHVSAEQQLELMQRSHALLVTSVKEGWGLVVTEANSQGTPAIVYDVDGLRDSVRQNQTGIITSANPTALATGLTQLLQDPATYATMRAEAYQWSKQITFEKSYQDFQAIINQSL